MESHTVDTFGCVVDRRCACTAFGTEARIPFRSRARIVLILERKSNVSPLATVPFDFGASVEFAEFVNCFLVRAR